MTDQEPQDGDIEFDPPDELPFHSAHESLPDAALHGAISPKTLLRIQDEPSFALVVTVPSESWIDPIAEAVKGLREWDDVIEAEVNARKRPASGSIARKLADGAAIAGIAVAPDRQLPASLVSAADARIVVAAPTNAMIRHAISLATGDFPGEMPEMVAAGLDFHDLVAAIRVGSTPDECVARLISASRSMAVTDHSLADVPLLETMHGYGQAHEWALRLLKDLESWRRGDLRFDQIDRHCVLSSAPGLGKTTFVRALARSARLPLFSTSVAAWFQGTGDGNLATVMREAERVFASAAASAPGIVLLDEAEALPSRENLSDRNRDYWVPLISQILLMLDSATSGPSSRLIVIGATNYGNRLDPALVRPGRLNKIIEILPPDTAALAGIMRQHLGADLPGADLAPLAELASGVSGAQVMGWVKEARLTARQAGRDLHVDDLLRAIAPPDDRPQADRRRFAVHEAGHAVLSHRLNPGIVHSVSIVLRGDAAGHTSTRRWLGQSPTRAAVETEVITTMAGRAAEIEILGDASTGAGGAIDSDLGIATRMVASLYTSYGLGPSLIHMGEPDRAVDEMRFDRDLRDAVFKAMARLHDEALRLVKANRAAIEAVAEELLRRRHLDAAAFLAVLAASDAGKPTRKAPRHG